MLLSGNILYPNGTVKPVSEVQKGDTILGWSETSKEFQNVEVLRIGRKTGYFYVDVELGNGEALSASYGHMFWCVDKGWVAFSPEDAYEVYKIEVSQLEVGDRLLGVDGEVEVTELTDHECEEVEFTSLDTTNGVDTFVCGGVVGHNEPTPFSDYTFNTLTISPIPSDSTVVITPDYYVYAQSGNSIVVITGGSATYTVSKTGYVTQSATVTVSSDQTITVTLVPATKTLTVTPTPSEATVTLTSSDTTVTQSGNSISVEPNSTVSYSVAKSGYYTKQDTVIVADDTTLPISLTSYPATMKALYVGNTKYIVYSANSKKSILIG